MVNSFSGFWTLLWECFQQNIVVTEHVDIIPGEHEIKGGMTQGCTEGRETENNNHRKLTNLITWTTALSNSMKPWAMPYRATQDGWVMVESSNKTWSTGEGNGKPLQYSCLGNPMNSMKRQNDRILKGTPQVSRGPICYWRRVEKYLQKEWRDGAKAKTTPSCGCDWW